MNRITGVRSKDERGFSLIELIVVIAIMAVLVGVMTPMFLKYVDKTKKAKDVYTADQIAKAVNVAFVENPEAYAAFQKWTGTGYTVTAKHNGEDEEYYVYLVAANGDYPYCFGGTTREFKGDNGFYAVVNRELGLSTTKDNGDTAKPKFTQKREGTGIKVNGTRTVAYADVNCYRIVRRKDNGMLEIWAAQNPPITGYPIYRLWPEPDDIYRQ